MTIEKSATLSYTQNKPNQWNEIFAVERKPNPKLKFYIHILHASLSLTHFLLIWLHIPSNTLLKCWNVNVFMFFTILYFLSALIQLDPLNDESPLSAASSSGTRTIPMPHFRHLLASLQVRSEYFSAITHIFPSTFSLFL